MEKREYVAQMAEKITEYSGKLHELRGQVFLVQTDMRKEYLTRMKALEHKQDKLRETYGHVKEASIINWKYAQTGTEKALAELKEDFDKTMDHFKL